MRHKGGQPILHKRDCEHSRFRIQPKALQIPQGTQQQINSHATISPRVETRSRFTFLNYSGENASSAFPGSPLLTPTYPDPT